MHRQILKNSAVKRTAASWLLVILLCNLVFAGLAVPQKKAQAFGEEWATIANYFTNAAKFTWDKIKWVYEKSADAIQSAAASWQQSEALWVKATKAAWNILRKKLLDMLVNDTIKWIQGSGNGAPLFVTDWQKYLRKAVNQAGGQFIDEYLNMDLCQTLKPNLRLLLDANETRFEESVACTLDDIEDNLKSFYADFSKGGWKTWASISEGQNNLYGAYLFGTDQLLETKQSALNNTQNELISSSGFKGDKVCYEGYNKGSYTEVFDDQTVAPSKSITLSDKYGVQMNKLPNWFICTRSETRTPGTVLANTAQKVTGIDIDWLISADEFNEYAGAILDAVVNRVSREGLSHIKSAITKEDEKYRGRTPLAEEIVNPDSFTDTQENQNLTISFIKELNRIYQNLTELRKQGSANLAFLEENLKRQRLALDTFSWIVTHGCDGIPDLFYKSDYTIWMTDVTNPDKISVLHDFPLCGAISHPGIDVNAAKIKVELDRIGWIIFSLSASAQPCIAELSSKTQIEDFLGNDLELLRERYNPDSIWINNRQGLVATAKESFETFRISENAYYNAKKTYLKTGEIDAVTGLPVYNPGLMFEEQTEALALEAAKENMDKDSEKVIANIKAAIASLTEQDSQKNPLSVSLANGTANLPQLFREIQEISSNIADEASNAQTLRGIEQTSPIKPVIKCTEEQTTGKNSTSDLCYITEVIKHLACAYVNKPIPIKSDDITSRLKNTIASHYNKIEDGGIDAVTSCLVLTCSANKQ